MPQFSDALLMSERLPDTCMQQKDQELGTFQVEGVKLVPVTPMKNWKIDFEGKMKLDKSDKTVNVKINAAYTSNFPHFNYDTDMNPMSYARAIAKEPWSREYFENLREFHQTHYEQYGDIKGHAIIDNETYPLFLNSFRDHSYGKMRDWKLFHRYVIHFFSLENGDRITVGVVSLPVTFSE